MVRGRHDRVLRLETLEGREMLAVFTVTNLNDVPVTAAGQAPGTLRQAVFDANSSMGTADTIQFSAGLAGTIQLNVAGDTAQGASAFLVTSPITIRGNANGITIGRASTAPEMRLFRVATTGNLTLETIMLTSGLVRGENGASAGVPGGEARGGAIFNQGTVEIVASTLYGNSAIGGNASGAAGGRAVGGAVANDGGTLTLKNTTVSGNSAASGTGNATPSSFGGGVHSLHGLLRIYNSTLTENISSTGRQVYVFSDAGTATVELFSSILGSDDSIFNLREFVAISDVNGVLSISASHNVVRTQLGLDSTQYISDDPQLGPLQANGGPTLTHAFAATSPALNAGTNPLILTLDQRGTGFSRSVGGVDIGAFELQTAPTLAGDYNRDGTVGAADYVHWRKTMGATVSTYAAADGDGSGSIDPADLGVWSQNFGRTAAGGAGGEARTDFVDTPLASVAAETSRFEDAWADNEQPDEVAEVAVEFAVYANRQAMAADSRGKALLAALLEWQNASRGDGIAFE